MQDFYVDDFVGGSSSDTEAAKELVHNLITELQKHGMELRKWTSNDNTITLSLPEGSRESSGTKIID